MLNDEASISGPPTNAATQAQAHSTSRQPQPSTSFMFRLMDNSSVSQVDHLATLDVVLAHIHFDDRAVYPRQIRITDRDDRLRHIGRRSQARAGIARDR